jgi:hypothetical protein
MPTVCQHNKIHCLPFTDDARPPPQFGPLSARLREIGIGRGAFRFKDSDDRYPDIGAQQFTLAEETLGDLFTNPAGQPNLQILARFTELEEDAPPSAPRSPSWRPPATPPLTWIC